jgi:hypothetical protein
MDIVFLITTCNRQESCQRLVDSINGLGDIYIVNDGSDYIINGANLKQHFIPARLGGYHYWKVVNLLFSLRGYHKYYFMLPDDFVICESQIEEAIRLWKDIKDPQKICLNLYTDRIGLSCWTHFKPVDMGEVWQTGWVDMCFLAEDKFFRSSMPITETPSHKSSGVGAHISRKLHKLKFSMYQVKESLVTVQPEHFKSQMHDDSHLRNSHIKRTGRIF